MDNIDAKPIMMKRSRNIFCLTRKCSIDGLSTSKNIMNTNVPVASPCKTTDIRNRTRVSLRLLIKMPMLIPNGDAIAYINTDQYIKYGFALSESICDPI